MTDGPSLTEKLAAIKKAQAAKAAEAGKIEEAHGEALEEDRAREAMSEAQVEASKEDALRTGMKLLEGEFAVAEKEAQDAKSAIAEAQEMLADSSLDSETKEAIKAVIEEGQQKISEFAILNSQYRQLSYEVAVLNKDPGEDEVMELQRSGADIKFLDSDGRPEDGWEITGVGTGKVFIANSQTKSEKAVPVSEFLSWQSGEVAEVAPTTITSTTEEASVIAESPEILRRKELIEEIREEKAREKLSAESRRIKVYTEKGQGMTIEEAKAKKAEIGEVDIIMNRSNINALMEAGLLSPEDVVNQVFKPYYEKHESFEECRKRLSVLPKEVIKKLDLENRKYEKDISELIKNGMEQAYGRGSVIDRAYAFFQLPDLGDLNTGALAFSGLEPGNAEWTKARDSMVGLLDGENKGSLLISTTGDLPELMFNSVDLGWLNREQILRWIKDSNEIARGSDNEARVISKTLELQEEGYISPEEAEELLK